MKTVEIWDKESPINGVDAETYLKSNPYMRGVTVFFVKEDGRITRIEDVNILKSVYALEGDDTEVAAQFEKLVNRKPDAEPELSPLEKAVKDRLAEIDEYDTSPDVNGFFVSGIHCWITADERARYNTSIQAAELLGRETIELPLAGMFVTLPVSQAKLMLALIQDYADRAAIVTAKHKAAVMALESVEEVGGYDFKTGYPDRITLEIPTAS
jgi:hypothetical protein